MNLTVQLKNIGILKQAEFTLGDLTIICGKNNTGKTYATYALYGFLQAWRKLISIPVNHHQSRDLLTDGVLTIDLAQYVKKVNQILAEVCEDYVEQLDQIFAAPEDTFQSSEFHLHVSENNIRDKEINQRIEFPQRGNFEYSKHKGSEGTNSHHRD